MPLRDDKDKIDATRRKRKNPWRYFGALINGRNFQLAWQTDQGRSFVRRTGFHTTVHVRARSASEAELRAMEALRRDKSLRASVRNTRTDPPTMFLKSLTELRSFRGRRVPRTGFAFYPERGPRVGKKRRAAL
jgi:hypothetical protein